MLKGRSGLIVYGALCLVLITAAAFVCFFPMQMDDAAATGSYTVSGDTAGIYDDLADAFSDVNSSSGVDFIITVNSNDPSVTSFTLDTGKNVTLVSSAGDVFTLTMTTGVRHGTVNGNLSLEAIVLAGNNAGGGIEVSGSGTLTMNSGAVIRNCYNGINGGAISSNGTVTMNSGSAISGNTTAGSGGAVYNLGTFEMQADALISNNTANSLGGTGSYWYGGGGGVYNKGTFVMYGGGITGNTIVRPAYSNYNGGGGVYNYNGIFTMYGGDIYKNEAIEGGGVYNFKNSVLTMSNDASISRNTGVYGGGVYNSGTIFMEDDSKISYNYAMNVNPPGGGYGGGVYNISKLSMQDRSEISNNKGDSYGGGVYSHGYTYVDGSLRGTVFTMTGGKVSDNVISSGAGGSGVALISDLSGSNTFNMSGGEISGNKGGFYGGVYMCYYAVFNMSGDALISNNTAINYGGGVYVYFKAVFNMSGGKITGNNGGYYGGGVCCYSNGIFNMYGGEISDNSAINYGGGMFNYVNSTFNMSGGKISDNRVGYGAGVSNYGSTFSMSGDALISENTASTCGGGVYNYNSGTISMTGGEIYDNEAIYGGGLYNGGGTIEMNNGSVISGNTATIGGGVYNASMLNIVGGMITDNTAKGVGTAGSGGGIYAENFNNLTVADGVVFSGNTASTLRINDITPFVDVDHDGIADTVDYAKKIGAVVLDASVYLGQNAAAYNNYDINYPGNVYVIIIDIDPDGAGTVTVADGDDGTEYGTLTADGWIYVPITINSITLSADPTGGYELKQFTIDGTSEISDNPATVPITGNMSVIAEFNALPVPPEPDDYTITATADKNSTVSPSGDVTVAAGENKTFTFSANKGYSISAVYVDGVAISSVELASGEYTFYDVLDDHTINVVSKADGGAGGNGNNGGGNESGNTDGGGDDGRSDVTDEGNLNVSDGRGGSAKWALLNLICAFLATFTGVVTVIAIRNRMKEEKEIYGEMDGGMGENEGRMSRANLALGLFALAVGIVSVIVFIITEDWTLPVSVVDRWTFLMLVMFFATLIIAVASFGFDKEPRTEAGTSESK